MDTAIFEKYGLKPLEPLLETGQITMWKMTQPAINRTVLVHVLGTTMSSDPNAVAYLFSVARSISNSSAPAIAQIYTIFDEPDLKAIVSEYVDGLSLEQAISALGPLSMKQTVRTGLAVAEALKEVWDSSHIIYGSVRPEFITLDAGATAKLISPCYAQVASADMEVPESDMADLGELLYFLATGVRPGQAHNVSLPREFTGVLEKLSSESPMMRFASWDSVIEALRGLDEVKPAAPAASAGAGAGEAGKQKLAVKRSFSAPAGKVPKAVKQAGPARSAAIAPRLAIEPPKKGSEQLQAVRKAARERAMAEDKHATGVGAKFFACVMLVVVLGCVFVMRVGLEEFKARVVSNWKESLYASPEPQESTSIAVDDTPQPQPQPASSAETPVATAQAQPVQSASTTDDNDADSLLSQMDDDGDSALNRYLAAHVGSEVPFIHKGVEHKVTLVSYTADTVTIRTRKTLTLKRSELTKEQLDLWK